MTYKNADRLLSATDAFLTRYLLAGADGEPRPMRYNPIDYQTLKFIESHPKTRATDISHALFLPPTTMQSALDRLVKMDLVRKSNHPKDGRAKIYELSKQGVDMRAKILAQDRANMNEMLSTLTPVEQEQLLISLEKVEKYLRAG
jgi:DNA-binding MarR family transcriptional regulator